MMGIAISRMSDEVVSLIEARTGEIQAALARNEELLLNILPESIAARKLANEKVIADSHESCSVLFGDIVGFTEISARLGPEKLVGFLDEIFLNLTSSAMNSVWKKSKLLATTIWLHVVSRIQIPIMPTRLLRWGEEWWITFEPIVLRKTPELLCE